MMAPFELMLTNLDTIPGVDRKLAVSLVAETGGDMSRFPSAAHLCSWGAMCPGQNESAGKRRSGRTRHANAYLRGMLIESGLAATRANATALQARYYRVKRHRGHKKAVVAVGRQILEIAYYIMRDARRSDRRDAGGGFTATEELRPLDIPGREVGPRAHPLVLMFDSRDAIGAGRHRGMSAAAHLNVGFFVGRQDVVIRRQWVALRGASVQIEEGAGFSSQRRDRAERANCNGTTVGSRRRPASATWWCHGWSRHDTPSDDLALQLTQRPAGRPRCEDFRPQGV